VDATLRAKVALLQFLSPAHVALWNRDGEVSVSEPDPAMRSAENAHFSLTRVREPKFVLSEFETTGH
jgi:hypothetical protein